MEQARIQDIINRSAQGDTKAFAMLVTEFQQMIYQIAFRLLCNEDDARDIVQETFVKVWVSIERYDTKFKFSTWIYKIALNVCYDKLRALQPINRETDLSTLQLRSNEDTEKHLIDSELKELIIVLTTELTPAQKLVFTLRDLEELNTHEIEIVTGFTAAKIKSNLYLARKYIRNRIKDLKL